MTKLEPYQHEILARIQAGKRLILITPRRDPLWRFVATLATIVGGTDDYEPEGHEHQGHETMYRAETCPVCRGRAAE